MVNEYQHEILGASTPKVNERSTNKLSEGSPLVARTQTSKSKKIFDQVRFPEVASPKWRKLIKTTVAEKPFSFSKAKCLPIETRNGYLKTVVFASGIQAIEQKKITAIMKHAKDMGLKRGMNTGHPNNPFRVMFFVLCTDETYKISAGNRSRWAIQLHYAYLHGISPANLLGFLYQEGSHELIAKRYKELVACI